MTPLEPEDLYTMSERLDVVINGAKNVGARRARHSSGHPDAATAGMADLLVEGTDHVAAAVRCIRDDPTEAEQEGRRRHPLRPGWSRRRYRAAIGVAADSSMSDALSLVTTYEAYRS